MKQSTVLRWRISEYDCSSMWNSFKVVLDSEDSDWLMALSFYAHRLVVVITVLDGVFMRVDVNEKGGGCISFPN